MWLASASVWRGSWIVGTGQWRPRVRDQVAAILRDEVMDGIGDLDAQRLFRMNVTLCLHRSLTTQEEERLPADWHEVPPLDIAGGPVEVLWENVPARPSAQPCGQPRHVQAPPGRPDLWIPEDCGRCEPCLARAEITSYCGLPDLGRS